MLRAGLERIRQKRRTVAYPGQEPQMPARFRGAPAVTPALCRPGCSLCSQACAFKAISQGSEGPAVDLGRCIFCGDCRRACPTEALNISGDYRLAASRREELIRKKGEMHLARALEERTKALFGRSLKLRQVSAGGCNACEADLNVLTTVVFDLARFGIDFVASPRHADGICVTGPVSKNMREALLKCYHALAEPKLVIAVGACSIAGGPFAHMPQVHDGLSNMLPVDLFVPGCPPHPYTTLDGLLRLLGRL